MESTLFSEIGKYMDNETLLVFNDTRVIQARLLFLNNKQQTIELFCLEPETEITTAMQARGKVQYRCLVGNLKRWKETELSLNREGISLSASILQKHPGHVLIEFRWTPPEKNFSEVLETMGRIPIPPYLNRDTELIDESRYQTVYARQKGSVAAPTAGLHFTDHILEQLKAQGVGTASLTLHVGAGTFKPVKSDTLAGHDMHAEWIEVKRNTIKQLIEFSRGKIIPVGTTSLRSIESLYWMGVKTLMNPVIQIQELEIKQWEVYVMRADVPVSDSLHSLLQWMDAAGLPVLICKTQILIAPPYQLKVASGLITNFHQPKSTLLLLINAVLGENWRKVYDYAKQQGFRFLSYGDSSLLLK